MHSSVSSINQRGSNFKKMRLFFFTHKKRLLRLRAQMTHSVLPNKSPPKRGGGHRLNCLKNLKGGGPSPNFPSSKYATAHPSCTHWKIQCPPKRTHIDLQINIQLSTNTYMHTNKQTHTNTCICANTQTDKHAHCTKYYVCRVISRNLKLVGIDKWLGVNMREGQIYIKNIKKAEELH